jgi:hypothetical protein
VSLHVEQSFTPNTVCGSKLKQATSCCFCYIEIDLNLLLILFLTIKTLFFRCYRLVLLPVIKVEANDGLAL